MLQATRQRINYACLHALQFDGGVSVTVETLETRPVAALAAAAARAQKCFAASDSDEEAVVKVAPPPLRPSGNKKKIGLLRR